MHDLIVIGGGIVGLATARELRRRNARASILLVEKETRLAAHQSGRNSNVIHSGVYYRPGSLKAKLASDGNRSMVEFCRANRVPVEVCGKLIVATTREELSRLAALRNRALENGVAVEPVSGDAIARIEPHVRGLEALRVPTAAITDFRLVCEAIADELRRSGVEIALGGSVTAIRASGRAKIVEIDGKTFEAGRLVVCAGLQSDRLARLDGLDPGVRIIPFRGEYWDLVPERRDLVRGLIYPVPDPDLPFLGVHLTRTIDGRVHAGPNAVLGLARERYGRGEISLQDLAEATLWSGFWRMAGGNVRAGVSELARSLSKRRFVASARRLVPALEQRDLVRGEAGIRAQAVRRDGSLVDDFLFARGERSLHVLNAPSPAATAAFAIAREIATELET